MTDRHASPKVSRWLFAAVVVTGCIGVGAALSSRRGVMPAPSVRLAQPVAPVAPSGPAPDGARVFFPDSSVRVLDPADLAGLTPLQLRLARNEILAREGQAFEDPALRAYFAQFSWYRPARAAVRLNPIERLNTAMLARAEQGS